LGLVKIALIINDISYGYIMVPIITIIET